MDQALMARVLFGLTLAFHIIFASLGVGLPFMIMIAELLHLIKKDNDYLIMASRWTKGFTVLLAVGITTGTTVALQLSLLWPKFMHLVGQVIALPFLIEIFAFFLEALFMSIYVYASHRIPSPWKMVSVAMVALGAALSAILITDANAFMNTPQGFQMINGNAIHIRPWQAFFNPSFPIKLFHVLVTAYMTVAFITASIAAFGLWKNKHSHSAIIKHQQKALVVSLIIATMFSLLAAFSGDGSGKFIAAYQPEKLAAGEGLFKSQMYAPFVYGGWPSGLQEKIVGGLQVPGLLSFLATGKFNGLVKGLYEYPRDTWPPLYIHFTFDAMITIGSLLLALGVFALALSYLRNRQKKHLPRWMLLVLIFAGPLSMAAIECGWVYAEVGRQPWIVYHVMRTQNAVTSASYMGLVFVLFILLFFLLAVGTIVVIRGHFKRHPLAEEFAITTTKAEKEGWQP